MTSDLLLVYTTWANMSEAKRAAKHLLTKRLCGCVNIFPGVQPMFWWPPGKGKLDSSKEVVMIIKTLREKYEVLEKEILKIHSFDTPCVIAIPVYKVSSGYYDWIDGEVNFKKKIE